MIRNLPGLLEVLVLSRLNMRQGASYAITTILNYIIIAVGAMTVFGSLGVSWDKLQWLAAALSVGLGFGLQEIFGNFVSGLIILFERPVRIGDTVTIGSFGYGQQDPYSCDNDYRFRSQRSDYPEQSVCYRASDQLVVN